MKKYKIFILYYIIGIVASLSLSAYPLIFSNKGFNTKQTSLLISLGFLMAIFTPVTGYITDRFYTNLKMAKFSFIILSISSITMFLCNSTLFIIALIINGIFRAGIVAFLDSYVTKYSNQFELSYAKSRTALPIGFASAFFIGEIFIKIFNLQISGMLLFISIILILGFIILLQIEDKELTENKHIETTNITNDTYDKSGIITLIMYAFLYAGLYQISSSYLSIFFVEFGYNTFIIGLLNLSMLIPQLFLLLNYDKIFGNLRNSSIMIICAIIGILQSLIYIIFPHNIILLFLGSLLSGTQLVIYPASFYKNLTKAFKQSRVATGLTINSTIQALWVGIFNIVFISHLYNKFNTTIAIYITVVIVMLISLIPVYVYRLKHKNS